MMDLAKFGPFLPPNQISVIILLGGLQRVPDAQEYVNANSTIVPSQMYHPSQRGCEHVSWWNPSVAEGLTALLFAQEVHKSYSFLVFNTKFVTTGSKRVRSIV